MLLAVVRKGIVLGGSRVVSCQVRQKHSTEPFERPLRPVNQSADKAEERWVNIEGTPLDRTLTNSRRKKADPAESSAWTSADEKTMTSLLAISGACISLNAIVSLSTVFHPLFGFLGTGGLFLGLNALGQQWNYRGRHLFFVPGLPLGCLLALLAGVYPSPSIFLLQFMAVVTLVVYPFFTS